MKKIYSIFMVLVAILVCVGTGIAKEYVVVFDLNGNMARIDVSSRSVLVNAVNVKMTGESKLLGIDTNNKNIFMVGCENSLCSVSVYNLTDFKLKRKLPIELINNDVKVLIYPDGSRFLIQYLTAAEGDEVPEGYVTDIYNAITLSEIGTVVDYFNFDRVMFSRDNAKMYSIVDGDEAHVNVINPNNGTIVSSINLLPIKRQGVYYSGVKDAKNSILLFGENIKQKQDDSNNLDFMVYDIDLGKPLSRAHTDLQGDLKLTPNGTSVVLDENITLRKVKGVSSYVRSYQSTGKMTIYDANTGLKKSAINFEVKGRGEILGFDSSSKIIFYTYKNGDGTSKILMLDTEVVSNKTMLTVPFEPVYFADFFESP